MFKYSCLNPISTKGLGNFTKDFQKTDNVDDAEVSSIRTRG